MTSKLLPLRTGSKHVGKHLILDAWRASADLLNDPDRIRDALVKAVESCGATLVNISVHQFSPYGVTATATLAESHIAIHTWPEHGYFGADLFFCGAGAPERAMETLIELLAPREVKVRRLNRGIRPAMEGDDLLEETVEGV